MKTNLCIDCNERPIAIYKWLRCRRCYGIAFQKGKIQKMNTASAKAPATLQKREHIGELEFVKNYFKTNKWIIKPARFNLNGLRYTPDFYDIERNVFIEVSRTRQAYHANKEKYELMKLLFPKLNFEIRKPSGELLNEDNWYKNW